MKMLIIAIFLPDYAEIFWNKVAKALFVSIKKFCKQHRARNLANKWATKASF